MSVSERAKALGGLTPMYFHYLQKLFAEQPDSFYDKEKNPDGIMVLTVAENNLCLDMVKQKIAEVRIKEMPSNQYNYGNNTYFRQDLARFFEKTIFSSRKSEKLDPKNFVVGNGAGPVVNMLAFILCNPGEGIIIPAPYYAGFDMELGSISHVEPIPANLCSSNNFELEISTLQEALDKAKSNNVTVKAVLVSSPNNPMGTVYSKKMLIDLFTWAKNNGLHLIVDEIYALSTHEGREFVSISSVLAELGEPFGDFVHVIWSFSKDFALSGFRVGVLYSENQQVIQAANFSGFFHLASNYAQFALHELLNDDKFVTNYIETSQHKLAIAYKSVTATLQALAIPFIEGGSGFFVLINLHKYLNPTKDEWAAENELWQFLAITCKVIFTPGLSMRVPEAGWFRLCFATYETPVVVAAINRMAATLNAQLKQ